ncbi:hypothetical protein LINPERHAP1_LOCUS8337 [Linum perenne]
MQVLQITSVALSTIFLPLSQSLVSMSIFQTHLECQTTT